MVYQVVGPGIVPPALYVCLGLPLKDWGCGSSQPLPSPGWAPGQCPALLLMKTQFLPKEEEKLLCPAAVLATNSYLGAACSSCLGFCTLITLAPPGRGWEQQGLLRLSLLLTGCSSVPALALGSPCGPGSCLIDGSSGHLGPSLSPSYLSSCPVHFYLLF